MAATVASEAEKSTGFRRHYPSKTALAVELWLKVTVGLAEHQGAPEAIDEKFLINQGVTNLRAFINGRWWRYWSSSLPAMMKE